MFNKLFGYIELVISFLALSACYSAHPNGMQSETNIAETKQKYTIHCKLTSFDLTEDMSVLSTKNDEVILLVYRDLDIQAPPDLLYQDYFILDSINNKREFILGDSLKIGQLIFVLIELDTEKNLKQIEPIVRLNLDTIYKSDKNGNYKAILELFGDDDLIGIKKIGCAKLNEKNLKLTFKGKHLFDSYFYEMQILKVNLE